MNAPLSTSLFDELLSCIEVVGLERTIKSLKDAKSNHLILSDLNIEFILTCVSEKTGVPKERILSGKDRTDERKIAVSLSVYFMKKELKYSLSEIKKIFDKDESALSRYFNNVESIIKKPDKLIKSEFDKEIKKSHDCINLIITSKKLEDANR